jgi:hypothetical protein
MSNKNLFKEAIADAKAIRETALLNAKNALEEALTPSIQNMLVSKLNEMDYTEEEDMYQDEMDSMDAMGEGMYPEDTSDEIQDRYRATGAALEEEFDLSEILAELEAEEAAELKEAKKKEKDEEDEEESEEDEEESEEEMEVSEMSVDDLKDLIKDIVSQELEAGNMEAPSGEEEMDMSMDMGGEEMTADEEEEINLEELLAELDSMDNNLNEYAEADEKEMLMSICNDYPEHSACKGLKEARKIQKIKSKSVMTSKDKEEMKEAINVINTLRRELNETNLLNAKLLYVNKIFKAKNLSESQKLSVIASFDKANTPKEAKMVYESLSSTLTSTTKKAPLKESLGFASKAAGIAPKKQNIVESNDVISRMQKLANIIK